MGKKKSKKKSGKKSKKSDAGADEAPDPTAGLSIEELREQITATKKELDIEREDRNYFQLERDKINSFWEITKRQHEECKADLRNKDRELEEAAERHAVEIKVYKQKVKHLLYENQTQIHELKTDTAVSRRLAANDQRASEAQLNEDKRGLKMELKHTELEHEAMLKNLQLEYDKKMTSLRDDLQRTAVDMRRKYETKMDLLRDELELRRKVEIKEIEERKNSQIHALMKNHEKAFGDIKNYYNDITLNNMALINSLKEQVEEMKTKGERDEKLMSEIKLENKNLVEPLAKANAELGEMRKHMVSYNRDKQFLASAKARLKVQDGKLEQYEWQREVLEQRFEKVQKERDDLYDRFVKTIYDVQQKSGFKNLLLEKKLSTLLDQLEKKEAQLNEVLAASNLDPAALAVVTRKLEDVLDAKNAAIKDLQFELARACKAHNDVIRTYEAKLEEFGVPVDELGFTPMDVSSLGQALGTGPAGLVSAT
eukprot:m.343109 g.343109  ORF g.343109 m.343109 type:complete len:483 (+) comp20626_c1_seq3:127-1575(+)